MTYEYFATSVHCIDGRIQLALAEWAQREGNLPGTVKHLDSITRPGVNKIVSENTNIESIKMAVCISIDGHNSEAVLVSGHHDCAGNTDDAGEKVSDSVQKDQIRKAVEVISSWKTPNGKSLSDLKVIGLWVAPNSEGKWIANTV
ncbi:MAG: hypothetical protein OEW86_00820 [Nitrosopumilus sp.]|nr:hypothetical protein [Nitrosopumilus sp.]MDH5553575.1 hypothetical protein [Nitrosopumilus sp.]